jgi:hypothetical protein
VKLETNGFSPRLLAGPNVLVQVPHGVPAQGMNLFGLTEGIQVSVLPVCAMEDTVVSRWLSLDGVYRVEDMTGRARIGQGNIADRVRRHRAYPTVLPVRLVAMTGIVTNWTFSERCYLEEQLALDWVAQGFGLVSTTFNRGDGQLTEDQRIALDLQLVEGLWLVRLAERIMDRDVDELTAVSPGLPISVPSPAGLMPQRPPPVEMSSPGEVSLLERGKEAAIYRHFLEGTELMFTDGKIVAYAAAEVSNVTLRAGSTVHLATTRSTGKRFAAMHGTFLDRASVTMQDNDIGQTGRPVSAVSAAQLLKLVTGGRVHSATKWRTR